MAARLFPYFLNLAAYAECVEWAERVLALDPPPSPPLGLPAATRGDRPLLHG